MSNTDEPNKLCPITATPEVPADVQSLTSPPEQPENPPLNDHELEKVNGGIYRPKAHVAW